MLHENTRPLGEFLRDVMRDNMTQLPRLRPGRDGLQPPAVDLRGEQEDLDGGLLARGCRRRRARARRPGDGDALRAHADGLAGRLSADRPARLLPHLRSLRPRRGLDVQPAREVARHLQEPRAVARLGGSQNILLSSTVWRQDHNGFSHQDPGFIDLVTNKSPSVTRVYLPPDANTLLAVADQCLRSTDCINVIVADKQKHLQFTTIDEAIVHCAKGIGIWAAREQRRGRRARRGDGLVRRRRHPGGAGGHRDPARAPARPEAALRQRGGPVQDAAGRASTRTARPSASSTACSRSTSRSSSTSTAIPG